MRDAVYEKGARDLTVEELAKLGEGKDIVYQVVAKYDTDGGYDVSIQSTKSLDKALEIMKKDFLKESEFWMKDAGMGEKEIKELKESVYDYELNETSAYICIDDDYLSMYITANELE